MAGAFAHQHGGGGLKPVTAYIEVEYPVAIGVATDGLFNDLELGGYRILRGYGDGLGAIGDFLVFRVVFTAGFSALLTLIDALEHHILAISLYLGTSNCQLYQGRAIFGTIGKYLTSASNNVFRIVFVYQGGESGVGAGFEVFVSDLVFDFEVLTIGLNRAD